jgi:hypothetical protein
VTRRLASMEPYQGHRHNPCVACLQSGLRTALIMSGEFTTVVAALVKYTGPRSRGCGQHDAFGSEEADRSTAGVEDYSIRLCRECAERLARGSARSAARCRWCEPNLAGPLPPFSELTPIDGDYRVAQCKRGEREGRLVRSPLLLVRGTTRRS